MRILVLGGTWFLGRAITEDALARGWAVTTFNRGRSGRDVPGVRAVHGDRTSAEDVRRLGEFGPWDAVVDTSSSELSPREVFVGASLLSDHAARYVHISTVSVYAGWPHTSLTEESAVLECAYDADSDFGYTGADGSPTKYGFQKAGVENAVHRAFESRATVLRPGVILGPGEYVGRLPWWLARAARGGPLLAPAPADTVIQPVDVRDVARFALDRARTGVPATYNVAHPHGITFADFLAACLAVTGGTGTPVWAEPEFLVEHDVAQWTELPLWRTHAGVWSVDPTAAVKDGLRCRPLAETVADTWAWLHSGGTPVDHARAALHGIDPVKEQALLSQLA
ncbi:NAD-dependent epimerase/dehydratase family protein [Embleya sp. NPDC059259]|uniref:NAD-dependent epimerase/dehydratase family protein n=1 Tax=unclassified Embleya TaxID=2699296 RepID=UPI00369B50E1